MNYSLVVAGSILIQSNNIFGMVVADQQQIAKFPLKGFFFRNIECNLNINGAIPFRGNEINIF